MSDVDQRLKERIKSLSDDELLKMAYTESINYSDESVQFAISEVRRRGLRELEIKHCPRCRRPSDKDVTICHCGYNFEKSNLHELVQVEKKRRRGHRIIGLAMVLISGFFMFRDWMNWTPSTPAHHSRADSLFIGFIALTFLVGLWKLVFGTVARSPKKESNYFLSLIWPGDSHDAKEVHDDIAYFFCPSCSKQVLVELVKKKRCPHCDNLIE